MSKHAKPWPRLSETLTFVRHPDICQSCGAVTFEEESRWQEHDEADQPTQIVIVLCTGCAEKLIERHPRLYRQLEKWEPWPGAMPLCVDCTLRVNLRCGHPDARANGGDGIRLTYPQPTVCLVDGHDKAGRRRGWRQTIYHGPISACVGRVEATPPTTQGAQDGNADPRRVPGEAQGPEGAAPARGE